MSEESTRCTNPKIPAGCEVWYHENRGYDSPDRWYSARTPFGATDHGTFTEALEKCLKDCPPGSTGRWDRTNAVEFLQHLEQVLAAHGWHCALAGSVLYRGNSTHDLDVVVFPHKKPKTAKKEKMRDCFAAMGLRQVRTRREVAAYWKKKGIKDQKWVEVWMHPKYGRVDVLVLS